MHNNIHYTDFKNNIIIQLILETREINKLSYFTLLRCFPIRWTLEIC